MKAIYIEWAETVQVFSHREYIGGGIEKAIFTEKEKIHSARYSNTVSDAMIERAEKYIVDSRLGAKVVIK